MQEELFKANDKYKQQFLHEGVHSVSEKFDSAQGSVYFVKYDDASQEQLVLKNVSEIHYR